MLGKFESFGIRKRMDGSRTNLRSVVKIRWYIKWRISFSTVMQFENPQRDGSCERCTGCLASDLNICVYVCDQTDEKSIKGHRVGEECRHDRLSRQRCFITYVYVTNKRIIDRRFSSAGTSQIRDVTDRSNILWMWHHTANFLLRIFWNESNRYSTNVFLFQEATEFDLDQLTLESRLNCYDPQLPKSQFDSIELTPELNELLYINRQALPDLSYWTGFQKPTVLRGEEADEVFRELTKTMKRSITELLSDFKIRIIRQVRDVSATS